MGGGANDVPRDGVGGWPLLCGESYLHGIESWLHLRQGRVPEQRVLRLAKQISLPQRGFMRLQDDVQLAAITGSSDLLPFIREASTRGRASAPRFQRTPPLPGPFIDVEALILV